MLQSKIARLGSPFYRRYVHYESLSSVLRSKTVFFSFPHGCQHRLFGVSANCNNVSGKSMTDIASSSDPSLLAETAIKISDPTFAELGLATSWWPSHLIQSGLESFYITTNCPWWLTIIMGTVILRVVTLPIFIATRKGMIRFRNHMPETTKLRDKMALAIQQNDVQKSQKARSRLKEFTNLHKVGVKHLLQYNLPMPVIFISCMVALREMSGVPVPSLEVTEFLWLDSLSAPDQYRLLPALAGTMFSLNIFTSLKLGSTTLSPAIQKNLKYLCIAPPIIMPLLFGHWSSAIGLYMVVNSMASLVVNMLMLSNTVKQKLNFPEVQEIKNANFKTTMKSTIEKSRRKTVIKMENKEIQKMVKEQAKARKKELKGSPPVLYEIGTEAKLKSDIPDFEKDWRPPKVNIYR